MSVFTRRKAKHTAAGVAAATPAAELARPAAAAPAVPVQAPPVAPTPVVFEGASGTGLMPASQAPAPDDTVVFRVPASSGVPGWTIPPGTPWMTHPDGALPHPPGPGDGSGAAMPADGQTATCRRCCRQITFRGFARGGVWVCTEGDEPECGSTLCNPTGLLPPGTMHEPGPEEALPHRTPGAVVPPASVPVLRTEPADPELLRDLRDALLAMPAGPERKPAPSPNPSAWLRAVQPDGRHLDVRLAGRPRFTRLVPSVAGSLPEVHLGESDEGPFRMAADRAWLKAAGLAFFQAADAEPEAAEVTRSDIPAFPAAGGAL